LGSKQCPEDPKFDSWWGDFFLFARKESLFYEFIQMAVIMFGINIVRSYYLREEVLLLDISIFLILLLLSSIEYIGAKKLFVRN